MLSYDEARRVYDRVGTLEESQAFYEDPATDLLVRHGDFGSAGAVFEFGCGTGRFALRLFTESLSRDATYRCVDISLKMVHPARQRRAPYAPRA